MTSFIVDIETTGLNYLTDRITCISVFDVEKKEMKTFCEENEKTMLLMFFHFIYMDREKGDFLPTLIGKNFIKFDLAFIEMRSLKHELKIPVFASSEIDENIHINPETKYIPKLTQLADFFGLENKKANGLQAIEFWNKREDPENLKKLIAYCEQDVMITYKIWKIVSGKEGEHQ